MTDEQVQQARARAWAGDRLCDIARDLGIASSSARAMLTGKSHRRVPGPPPLPAGLLSKNRMAANRNDRRRKAAPGRQPCRWCELLTDDASGYCQFCQAEGRQAR